MENTLISLSEFVLNEQNRKFNTRVVWSTQYKDSLQLLFQYTAFLKQPLTLGMFVTCDENGNVLKKPKNYDIAEPIIQSHLNHKGGKKKQDEKPFHDYKKAKEKVLFYNAITIDESPYKMTKRFMINLNHPATFRIYNRFEFHDGRIETEFLPNFSKTPTIEYLVDYELELTESALKQIGINQ